VLKRPVALFEGSKMRCMTSGSIPIPVLRMLTVKTVFRWIVRGDYDFSSFRGEFDCVLQYVPNDLLKSRRHSTLSDALACNDARFKPILQAMT
jgi:hypothetical protein